MYRDVRPSHGNAETTSTPEMWAANFRHSTRVNARKMLRLSRTREWKLIKRYVPAGSSIVDMGCGFGEWVQFLKSRGYRANGCDYSPELIARLREAYPNDEWVQADIRNLPLADASYDALISWGVIEHDEAGPGAALREFRRVVRPGGHIVVTVPVDTPWARHATDYVGYRESQHAFYQYLLSVDEAREELAKAGFEVLEAGTLPIAHIAYAAPRLARALENRPLAFRIANFAATSLLSWMERYRVMLYVVGRVPR
ncbi:MAG TPA: class I SAM-dependent methyltransferase [Thermoanaerobaculia bacterium]